MNKSQAKDKGPLHPHELFKRLIQGDFKESECIDEGARTQE